MIEDRLIKATSSIKVYEDKEAVLMRSMTDLQKKYDRLLSGSMFALWEYCPVKSHDFQNIPPCDHELVGRWCGCIFISLFCMI
jgi:hypothetical protein